MPQINISTESLVAVGIVAVAVLGWTYARSAALTEPTSSTSTSANTATKKKGKKTKGKKSGEDTPGLATPPQESETPQPQKVTPPKIERSAPSFAQVAAPAAGSSDGGVLKPKTLAEKKATKPRKTKVDDMIPQEDRPVGPSRVMKIVSPQTSTSETAQSSSPVTPVTPPTEEVSSAHDDAPSNEDDGWDVPQRGMGSVGKGEDVWEVPKKGYASATRTGSDGWEAVPTKSKRPTSSVNRFSALSIPSAPSPNSSRPSSGSSTPTRIQRKNANAAAKKAAAKQDEEKERLERLAKYRKEQEREKIAAAYSTKSKKVPGSGKTVGGGMNPSVDMSGKLIWE